MTQYATMHLYVKNAKLASQVMDTHDDGKPMKREHGTRRSPHDEGREDLAWGKLQISQHEWEVFNETLITQDTYIKAIEDFFKAYLVPDHIQLSIDARKGTMSDGEHHRIAFAIRTI